MAVLYIRDKNGNKVAVPAIKGEKGDPYVLTEQDKKEIAGQLKPTEATGLSGEVSIESLPVGTSYAEADTTLLYLVNGEMNEYASLPVESGSCIIKTIGQVVDDGNLEMVDGAITVYVIPQKHVVTVDYDTGATETVILKKITPFYDMYGMQYTLDVVDGCNTIIDRSISSDPDYGYRHPNNVPSVGAVIDYVANHSGGGSSGMTELNCWNGDIGDISLGMHYVVDGANISYYDSNGELTNAGLSNGAVVIIGKKMDWSTATGYKRFAIVFEPDGYRYLG